MRSALSCPTSPRLRQFRQRRGSALVMAIIVSVVVSGMVVMIAWIGGGMAKSTSNYARLDRASYVAEGAAQQAYWLYKKNNAWRALAATPLTGSDTVDSHTYSYSVTCVTAPSGTGVLITSTANDGFSQSQVHMTLAPGTPPAALAISGTLSSTSQMIADGNVEAIGKITTSGSFTVNGNLTTDSTFGGGTVTGTTTTNASAPASTVPNSLSIYSQLLPSAYNMGNPGTVTTLDFTLHPVIAVTGNTTIASGVTILGSGTLLVSGTLKTGGDLGTSTTPATINLVATSDFTATNKFYVTGGVYSGGNVTFNNQTVLTGVVVANGSVTLNNHHTFIYTSPPSFDPRGAIVTTAYGGALP